MSRHRYEQGDRGRQERLPSEGQRASRQQPATLGTQNSCCSSGEKRRLLAPCTITDTGRLQRCFREARPAGTPPPAHTWPWTRLWASQGEDGRHSSTEEEAQIQSHWLKETSSRQKSGLLRVLPTLCLFPCASLSLLLPFFFSLALILKNNSRN